MAQGFGLDIVGSLPGGQLGALIQKHDWSTSPLGQPGTWPQPLRTLVGVVLGATQPMFVAWGPDHRLLYNDGYALILGLRHPAALGQPLLDVWTDVADDIRPLLRRADAGESVHLDDLELHMTRNGHLEETHFAFSYTPVRDEAGTVAGIFCICTEITSQVFAERQRVAESERLRKQPHSRRGPRR